MKKRLKKKAAVVQHVLFVAMNLALVVGIFIILLLYINSVKENTIFDKIYLSEDISLLINTIYSSPGNIKYFYETQATDLTKFSFRFIDNEAGVNEIDSKESLRISYPYGSNLLYYEDFHSLISPEKIIFLKNNNYMEINYENEENEILNKLICPKINTKDENWEEKDKLLLIDPGHGYSDKEKKDYGTLKRTLKESIIMENIAQALKLIPKVEFTREPGIYLSNIERIEKTKDYEITISLHTKHKQDNKNSLRAYINLNTFKSNPEIFKKQKKIACNILNSILENTDLDGATIIPIDPDKLSNTDTRKILKNKEKIIIYLELDDLEFANSKQNELPNLIHNGIKNYFENE